MGPLVSTIISVAFLIAGGIAVFCMISMRGSNKPSNPKLLMKWHRISGWLFVFFFLALFVFMIPRIGNYWEEPSARIALHVTFSVALLLLLALKVSIPRFFPRLGQSLFFIGIAVYVTAFTLVGITAGYYVVRLIEGTPYISHATLPTHMLDERLGQQLFITKCSLCHRLDMIMGRRSVEAWEEVVNKMIKLAEPRITVDEGVQILHYLSETHLPESVEVTEKSSVVAKHCLPCHESTDIFKNRHTSVGWREIVKQMNQYDKELVPEAKIDEIVEFLMEHQKQE